MPRDYYYCLFGNKHPIIRKFNYFIFCVLIRNHFVCTQVKEFFNEEFDDVLKTKQSEVTRTNERCLRIRQVIYDLKTKHKVEISTKSQMLAMHVLEEPGLLLKVRIVFLFVAFITAMEFSFSNLITGPK